MPKFMSFHTLPAGGLTREQLNDFADAAQHDPDVHGYRSFTNLSEGKVMCVMEASDKQIIGQWFEKMHLPCDMISQVELEGDQGDIYQT